jgi:hypothetical protein
LDWLLLLLLLVAAERHVHDQGIDCKLGRLAASPDKDGLHWTMGMRGKIALDHCENPC